MTLLRHPSQATADVPVATPEPTIGTLHTTHEGQPRRPTTDVGARLKTDSHVVRRIACRAGNYQPFNQVIISIFSVASQGARAH